MQLANLRMLRWSICKLDVHVVSIAMGIRGAVAPPPTGLGLGRGHWIIYFLNNRNIKGKIIELK